MTESQRLSTLSTAVGHINHAYVCLEEHKSGEAKAVIGQAIEALIRCRASIPKERE